MIPASTELGPEESSLKAYNNETWIGCLLIQRLESYSLFNRIPFCFKSYLDYNVHPLSFQAYQEYRNKCVGYINKRSQWEWTLVQHVWKNQRTEVDWPSEMEDIDQYRLMPWDESMGAPRGIVEAMAEI